MSASSSRSLLTRVLLIGALLAPPILHTGCLQRAAYQVRLQQKVRAHVYSEGASKVMKAARKYAEQDGWTIIDDDDDDGRSFETKPRSLNGQKQKLTVRVVKEDDGVRLEGDLLKTTGDRDQKFPAIDLELAVFEKLDPDGASKVKASAKKQSKEDAKQIRACARKAIDEDEKADE